MAQLVKTVQSLAIASCKTVHGLAIASVQTVMGVDNTSSGPTLVASDNFDSYNSGVDLGGQGNWVNATGNMLTGGSGDIYVTTSSGNTMGICYNSATINSDMRAEVTIKAVDAGTDAFNWLGAAIRCQTGNASCYGIIAGHDDLYLIKINSGTQATINSDTSSTFAAGYKIAIEASGAGSSTRIKVQIDTGGGWVDKWTNQDPGGTYLDNGKAGVCSWLLTSVSNQLDDWACYNL